MEGEMLVNAAEASNEVVFERTDGTFGGITTMHAWRDKLIVNRFGREKVF
jgi:hypothetical protein